MDTQLCPQLEGHDGSLWTRDRVILPPLLKTTPTSVRRCFGDGPPSRIWGLTPRAVCEPLEKMVFTISEFCLIPSYPVH